jgi:GNAT superfamily N-acetyltransferase
VIRPALDGDLADIERLVVAVVDEVYGHLFHGKPPPPEGNWARGLLAELDGRVIGVVVAEDDWIEDLWVARDHRNRGVGRLLLTAAERQIAGRGHRRGHLRVVAENATARRFYRTNGWSEASAYPHEKWGVTMLDLTKSVEA